jgi:IclR family acetate operon transcriptional repressor
MSARGAPTLIQSVQRALRLLEAVGEIEDRATAKELAHQTGIELSTTYHLLRTLTHEGYLQRLDDGSYLLGHRLDIVRGSGAAARAVARARPALHWLRDRLNSPVYLALYHDGEIVISEVVDSRRSPRIELWVGIHDAAHATALGKCILAQLEPEERDGYLSSHPLHQLTRHTVVDRGTLRRSLDHGCDVALDREEYALGVQCAAAPVRAPQLIGSVGFSASTGTRRPLQGTSGVLVEAAARVSRALAIT